MLTVAVAADIQKATEITEITEAWAKVMETKTEEDLVAVADLTTDNLTVEVVVAAEQETQACIQDVQQQQTELDHLVVKEDLVGDLVHLVADKEHLITGLHGLVLVAVAEMVNMELQEVAEAEDQQVAEDLVVAELEDHKQLITAVDKVGMEQVQVEAEITTQVEMVQREVLA